MLAEDGKVEFTTVIEAAEAPSQHLRAHRVGVGIAGAGGGFW